MATEATAAPVVEVDDGLAALLAGIAEEVASQSGMERAGIIGSFAARATYARRTMRGPQLAAMLQVLKQERIAALKSLAQRTAAELKGRMAAARKRYYRNKPKPPTSG